MLTEQETTDLRALLSMLDKEDLKSLAKTVTNTLLVPDDVKGLLVFLLLCQELIPVFLFHMPTVHS